MSLGPGKVLAEQKTLLSLGRKIFQHQDIENSVSDLFKAGPSIWLPGTHKNSLGL